MIVDMLGVFYSTKVRLRVGDEPVEATIRWYKAPEGALHLPATSFNSNVWNTEEPLFYPQSGIGEIGLERTWSNGKAPEGVTGKSSPTPLDWFVNGPPASAITDPPVTDCGKLIAAGGAPIGFGATIKTVMHYKSGQAGCGIGCGFDAILPGLVYMTAGIGVGAVADPYYDGGAYGIGSVGVACVFSGSVAAPILSPVGMGADVDPYLDGLRFCPGSVGVGCIFNATVNAQSLSGGIGMSSVMDPYSEGLAWSTSHAGIGGEIGHEIDGEPVVDGGAGLGAEMTATIDSPPTEGGGMGMEFSFYFT